MPNVAGVEYPYTPEGIAAAQQAQAGLDSARMSPPLTSPSNPMAQRQVPDLQQSNVGQWYSMGSPNRLTQGDPSFYGTQRSVPDLQPAPRGMADSNAWRGAASRSPSSPHATAPTYEDRYAMQSDPSRLVGGAPIRGQHTYARSPSNPTAQMPTRQQPRQPTFRDVSHRPQDWKEQMLDKLRGIMAIPGQVKQETGGLIGSAVGQASQRANQQIGNMMAYGGFGPQGFSQQSPSSPWYRPVAQVPRGQTIQTSGPANYGQSPSNPNWKPPKP